MADTFDQFNRLPPRDLEAERCVIGSMLLAGDDHAIIDDVRAVLRSESFYQADHGVLFDVITRLRSEDKPVDAVIVRAELAQAGLLGEIGGVPYLAQILNAVPSAAHAPHYASIVREKYVLREVIRAANDAIAKAYAPSHVEQASEIARQFLDALTSVAYIGNGSQIHPIGDVLLEVMDDSNSGVKKRIATGLSELDDMIGGIPIGKFTLVGGRPRIGKSQMCKQIVLNAARQGTACGIVTIEEDRFKIGQNYLSNASGIENNRIVYGTASEVEWAAIYDAVPGLSSLPIFIADEPVKLSEVECAIRTLVTKHNCELIVVDYLQLVDPEQESNENRELTLISRTLKQIFKRMNVAGIAACQLNRGNEMNGVRKPTMRDLRGSGSLEQDGDLILLLHREDVYHQGEEDYLKTEQLEVLVIKNKDGDSGTVPLWFSGKTQTILNWADRPGANPFSHIDPPHVPPMYPNEYDDAN